MKTIAIIKETKQPADVRTPLTPEQCVEIKKRFPGINVIVESCPTRCFTDLQYTDAGIEVTNDISRADILLGVKEVEINALIPEKIYLFFSHTIKKQPHNRNLLRAILSKNITMIDYETLLWDSGNRIIGFGRFAGIVGTHYALMMWGKKYGLYNLKQAVECQNMHEMYEQYNNIELPSVKIAVCGDGRVAHGCLEVLKKLKVHHVSQEEYKENNYNHAVYVHLRNEDFYARNDGKEWDKSDFYKHPEDYHSTFRQYYTQTDIMINAIFWREGNPVFFSKEQMKDRDFRIKVISDISCDIPGSIPSTLKVTSIQNPFYGYNPLTEKETEPFLPNSIDMQTVGNLPNELPIDASVEFGEQLIRHVLPLLIDGDSDNIIKNATIAKNGKLTDKYLYLTDYVS
ncbi:MAG: NAD(P)-dependent oxidoreductase [Bacteroidia bacterium]